MKNLTLLTKTLIILGSVFLFTYLAIFTVSKIVFVESFEQLEKHNCFIRLNHIQEKIQEQVEIIDTVNRDWAWWDDSCFFVKNINEEYIKSNLADETFKSLRVNLIGYFDTAGRPVFTSSFDLEKGEKIPFSSELRKLFNENLSMLQHENVESRYAGIMLLSQQPILLSSRPLLTSEMKGPIQGSLVFGRFLTDTELTIISKKSDVLLNLTQLNSTLSNAEKEIVKICLSNKDKTAFERVSSTEIVAYRIIDDIYGNPALLLKAKLCRSIFQQGLKTIKQFSFLLLGVSTLFCLIIILLLETQILTHVRSLTRSVFKLGNDPSQFELVPEKGPQEVRQLSMAINEMLHSLKQSTADLHGTNKKLEKEILKRKSFEKKLRKSHDELEEKVKKKTKELQNSYQQLAHAGRLTSLGEMATGIAHEINQPLTIISLAQQYLEKNIPDKGSDSLAVGSLKKIKEQVDRVATIILNMRTFARTSSSSTKPIDISGPLEVALSFFSEQLRLNDVELTTTIKEALPHVRIDPQKFEQILINLLSNARYAVEKKAERENYNKSIRICLTASANNKDILVEVEDNGIGMTTEELDRCQEPFFTTKEVGKGTGLGLSITRNIVTEFNGRIVIESIEGRGTIVRLLFPIENEE